MSSMPDPSTEIGAAKFFSLNWETRLQFIVELMRGLSSENNPQKLVEVYGSRMREIVGYDISISLSRRDLVYPYYRITRSTRWTNSVNPWQNPEKLPLLKGGLL